MLHRKLSVEPRVESHVGAHHLPVVHCIELQLSYHLVLLADLFQRLFRRRGVARLARHCGLHRTHVLQGEHPWDVLEEFTAEISSCMHLRLLVLKVC